jgi:trehalose/maltose hydrolase-like predicted phosphorylase
MPEEIKSVSFRVIWKGQSAAITVTHGKVTVKNLSDRDLPFAVKGQTALAAVGAEASLSF